ncbi:hydrolase [Sediminibacillus massiliensis]|uniref:hydrolase n=1 Tax=Sediminibacillus massiliensis TaxID=1926277 RepID=UPI0009885C02|nr:hydrolase [Sediminibacillus massiliensis]
MEKKKYYVNVGTQEISQLQAGNNKDFTIFATEDEVFQLREHLTEMYNSDVRGFWRSHVPIDPYHNDSPNDDYDEGIIEAFRMLHELGDEKTKAHIDSMQILSD